MLAVIAAVVFAIAFILNLAGTATDAALSPNSLLFVGLTLVALHLAGLGPGWKWSGRGRR